MQALLTGAGFSGTLHHLWRHGRRQRHGAAGRLRRALFRATKPGRRLRPLVAGHRRGHLHRPVDDVLQRGRRQAGDEGRRRAVPHASAPSARRASASSASASPASSTPPRKCCFNSMLARIVNEQGRAQVGKGWGGAQSPDCSGFTVAQLQTPRLRGDGPDRVLCLARADAAQRGRAAGQQRQPRPDLLLRPREVPMKPHARRSPGASSSPLASPARTAQAPHAGARCPAAADRRHRCARRAGPRRPGRRDRRRDHRSASRPPRRSTST